MAGVVACSLVARAGLGIGLSICLILITGRQSPLPSTKANDGAGFFLLRIPG